MPRVSIAKIAVEAGGDGAHERPSALGDAEGLAIGLNESVVVGLDKSLCLLEERRCGGAIAAMEFGGGERKIAHQALDHETAHAVGIAQAEAAHRGKPVLGDAAVIFDHRHAVLNVALRESADGRGAEPN